MTDLPPSTVLPICLFPPISWFECFLNTQDIVLEQHAYYEKSSFRNRYYIGAANGPQRLSVPVIKGRKQKSVINQVAISYEEDWQKLHFQSLSTAYNRSPYFEYYEDRLKPYLFKHYDTLVEMNLDLIRFILTLLQIEKEIVLTDAYKTGYKHDYRPCFSTRLTDLQLKSDVRYTQNFEDRVGFFPNLSILDLLFNEGPNALTHLLSK